jgi:hypothetical protein
LYTGFLCCRFRFLAADFLAAFFVVFVTAFFEVYFFDGKLPQMLFGVGELLVSPFSNDAQQNINRLHKALSSRSRSRCGYCCGTFKTSARALSILLIAQSRVSQ